MRLQQIADDHGRRGVLPDDDQAARQVFYAHRLRRCARSTASASSPPTRKKDGSWRKLEVRLAGPQAAGPADPDAQGLLRRLHRQPRPLRQARVARLVSCHPRFLSASVSVVRLAIRATSVARRLRCLPPTDRFHPRHRLRARAAIRRARSPELVEGLDRGDEHQVLLGVTGSGKTFTMAQVIARVNRPTLVMAHNKTLAAQLYQEFKRFFPENAVEYFVSYYDYYQPEAYVPATDTYIEKEATINDEIDRMRLSATRSLFERRDVIIVASVSCIYGLGSPEAYYGMLLPLERGQRIDREQILRKLVEIQYERNDIEFGRGTFRVRGDIVEVVSVVRRARAAHRAVRRRGRRAGDVRSADRQDDPPARQDRGLSEVALRHAARADQAGGRDDQGGARVAPRRARVARASCSRRSGCTSGRCSTSR